MTLKSFIVDQINSMKLINGCENTMDSKSFIMQHRTLMLYLPRQVGKTTVIKELKKEFNNSIIIDNYKSIIGSITEDKFLQKDSYRGKAPKYLDCLLLDEVSPSLNMLEFLLDERFFILSKGFFILALKTEVY